MINKIHNVQQKIGALTKSKDNPFFKSKYFDVNAVVDALIPLLGKEGLTVLQPLTVLDGKPALATIITDGEATPMEWVTYLPENPDPQKMGSGITYFRRYALVSLFLLQGEEDDDANAASEKARSTKKEKTVESEDFSL